MKNFALTIFIFIISFCASKIAFSQEQIHLQTEREKGSLIYMRIKSESVAMPELRGLKLLDKWQNNQMLLYEVESKTIEIEGGIIVLYLANAGLTKLDVRDANRLEELYCPQNKLQSLNLNSNNQLEKLDCAINELSQIDLSNNPKLTYLNIYANRLSSLDLSANQWLRQLYCGANQLQSLNLDEQKSLELLNCGRNKLKTLSLNPCPKLKEVYCGNNQLEQIAIPLNTELRDLYLNQNKLLHISLGSAKQLQRLWSFGNRLSKQELEDIAGLLPSLGTYIKGDFRLAQEGETGLVTSEVLEHLKSKGWNAIQTASDTWSDLRYYVANQGTIFEKVAQIQKPQIYPNPLKGARLFIRGAKPFTLVRLYSMQGQLIISKHIGANGSLDLSFDGLRLSGYYLLQLDSLSQLLRIGA